MLMRRNLFIIVYLATVSCLCVASSADHKPLDVEVRQAIEELTQITGANQSAPQFTAAFTQQMLSILRASNPQLPPLAEQIVIAEVQRMVQFEQASLQASIYRIYARHFTLAELRGLIAFNRSAVGIKANAVMPALMAESLEAGQAWS
jgi:hypothetical protein